METNDVFRVIPVCPACLTQARCGVCPVCGRPLGLDHRGTTAIDQAKFYPPEAYSQTQDPITNFPDTVF